MRAQRFMAGVFAGVTTLTVLGGCAAQQLQALEPKLELRNAAQQLADAQQAGFTLKLTGNPADLPAEAAGQDAEKLFTSSLTLAYDKGGPGAADDASSLAVTVDGVAGTEVRFVGGSLYAKAPVKELAAKFGASTADLKNVGGGALVAGRWVSVDAQQMAEQTGSDAEQRKAATELATSATNLLEGADVVRDSADDKHLIVTSTTTKAYAEAKRFATAVSPALAGEFPATAPQDKPIVLDLWIDGGRLTAAELNVLQFVDGATARVAARLEVTAGAPIAAPEGATKIDLSEQPYFGKSGLPGLSLGN